MKSILSTRPRQLALWIALVFGSIFAVYYFANPSSASNDDERNKLQDKKRDEPAALAAFRERVGKVTPVIVLLKDDPGAVMQHSRALNLKKSGSAFEELSRYAMSLASKQDDLLSSLDERGVRALLRTTDAQQIDGSIRHIEYRFTYLLNGFIAYVAAGDLEALKKQPEVLSVERINTERFMLDNAIDYSLGTQFNPSDRRFAVYGANQELSPQTGIPGHPEAPRLTALDGFEGQGINVAVIDSGVDWRHPMFGGIGFTTPLPRVSGQPASAADNRKIIYYYNLSSPGDPTDDFGHGTLVASNSSGYRVGPDTPRITGFFTGVNNPDGTPGIGIGPTPGGVYHGTAPQSRIMGYKVCGPAPQCLGMTPLSMEDAASPYTLVQSGNQGPTPVAKPVADVINLSLGDTAGSATAASSIAANNAALNGTIVVASAGNSGPGAGTIGAPSSATLAISVAASLDPGSVAGGDLLANDQIPLEPCDGNPTRDATCDTGTQAAGPPAEYGAASNANTQTAPPFNFKLFPVAGGGAIRDGSVSGHYVYVDATGTPPIIPPSVRNRIALVRFAGTFASGANPVAAQMPAAILLISATESATAVQVLNGIPTFTIKPADADVLLDRLVDGLDNSPSPFTPNPPNGAVSLLPIRAGESTSLDAFTPAMASFSSRGPNDNPTANFRQIKPDVTAPGVGINGAATPDGLPDDTVGLASTTGYTVANGTSFSGPITAGAIAVVRQRVRNELGLDTTNLNDANYRLKRFDSVTVSRALLQNAATNLRSGRGVPESDPALTASVNDLGSGHINIAGALALRAIMVSPTLLLRDADSSATGDQREFTVPARNMPTLDSGGNLEVLLPTASFGNVSIAGLQSTKVITRKVIIRDVTRGAGGGVYNLTYADNRNVDGTNFAVSFSSNAAGTAPITSIRVPSGGQATYFVRTAANGANIAPDTEFQWFVTATHAATGQTVRMPFYYRATATTVSSANAPNQTAPTAQPGTPDANGCSVDLDGSYNINWTYAATGGVNPVGFRVQEASNIASIFFDPADEPIVNGANSKWAGSAQWTTQVNPATTSPAYFVPDTAMQNESLTQIAAVSLVGASGATLSFTTNQSTEEGFDFLNVEVSSNNGATFNTLASYSGAFTGTRELDLGPYAGGSVRVRFRMVSDLVGPDAGTYVENIRISTNDYATLADTGAADRTFAITGRGAGTRTYRIAGLFSTTEGNVIGPYSNSRCVSVP